MRSRFRGRLFELGEVVRMVLEDRYGTEEEEEERGEGEVG